MNQSFKLYEIFGYLMWDPLLKVIKAFDVGGIDVTFYSGFLKVRDDVQNDLVGIYFNKSEEGIRGYYA